jgi:hypothetical protein
MGHKTDLDNMERRQILSLPGLEPRVAQGCPARSQSLYRQRYPGYYIINKFCVLEQPLFILRIVEELMGARGSVVVKALCYKPEGRGFEIPRGK